MIAENPLALSYILPADVFFLQSDKALVTMAQPFVAEAGELTTAAEPAINYTTSPLIAPVPAIPQMPLIAQVPLAPTPVVASANVPTPAVNFTYKGGFGQKFLVIVNYPNDDLMEPTHLNALESTIKRKEMSLDDVAIFNIGQYPGTDIKTIGRFFKPKRMLVLGTDAFPVGLPPQPLNQLTLLGTCQLLCSYNFGDMMANRDLIKTFWEQMKML